MSQTKDASTQTPPETRDASTQTSTIIFNNNELTAELFIPKNCELEYNNEYEFTVKRVFPEHKVIAIMNKNEKDETLPTYSEFKESKNTTENEEPPPSYEEALNCSNSKKVAICHPLTLEPLINRIKLYLDYHLSRINYKSEITKLK